MGTRTHKNGAKNELCATCGACEAVLKVEPVNLLETFLATFLRRAMVLTWRRVGCLCTGGASWIGTLPLGQVTHACIVIGNKQRDDHVKVPGPSVTSKGKRW